MEEVDLVQKSKLEKRNREGKSRQELSFETRDLDIGTAVTARFSDPVVNIGQHNTTPSHFQPSRPSNPPLVPYRGYILPYRTPLSHRHSQHRHKSFNMGGK